MKKIPALLFLIYISCLIDVSGQLPDTDIFLSSLKKNDLGWTFGTPQNITNRKGYDNQPCFMPDGKSILYVSVIDTTQSDLYRYTISSKKITPFTSTPESEYSPSCTPDGKNISIVRVDRDSGQRFYTFPINHVSDIKLIKGTDSIGYYCWLNDSMMAMFILGHSNTLQVLNTHTAERTLIAGDIGRCFKMSTDKKLLYFVIKGNEQEWFIYSMRISDLKLERVIQTLLTSEDFAILPDQTFLMGLDGFLFSYLPGTDKAWKKIADFTGTIKSFYRISVNSNGTLLALVAYTGKKP